jgi:hypothetical protein
MVGIDTIQLFSEKKRLRNEINVKDFHFVAKGCKNLVNGSLIVIRPHEEMDLATYDQAIEFITTLEIQLDTKFIIVRLDIAFNSNLDIDLFKSYGYARFLMETMAIKMGKNELSFTNINERVGNLKVNKGDSEISFYNSKDKIKRNWRSRLEFRAKNLQVSNLKKELESRLEEITLKLLSLDELNNKTSEVLAARYIDKYKKEVENGETHSFIVFLVTNRKYFITRRMFNIVYEAIGEKIPARKFLFKYKKLMNEKVYFIDQRVYDEFTKIWIKDLIKFKKGM